MPCLLIVLTILLRLSPASVQRDTDRRCRPVRRRLLQPEERIALATGIDDN